MIFTTDQIQNILKTVDLNTKYLVSKVLGTDVLSKQDKKDLKRWGFDLKKIKTKYPTFEQSYQFGRLSELLGDVNTNKITYNDFEKYLKQGAYQPLNDLEQYSLKTAKQRTYGHITGLGEGMKKDIVNSISQTEQQRRKDYEKVIKKELKEGVVNRKSLKEIVSDLGHKTGDWDRNWGRIVETEMQSIYQQGRADQIKRKEGDQAKVYKTVYPGACRHCISAYLTNGIGSKPIIFNLSKLESNGTNIGKKVAQWLPVVGTMHPYCRCELVKIIPGQTWNEENGRFEFQKREELERFKDMPKITVTVGDKVFKV